MIGVVVTQHHLRFGHRTASAPRGLDPIEERVEPCGPLGVSVVKQFVPPLDVSERIEQAVNWFKSMDILEHATEARDHLVGGEPLDRHSVGVR